MKEYCQNCSNSQLWHVYEDEKMRAKHNKGTSTGDTAERFAELAAEELRRRNLL